MGSVAIYVLARSV